MNDYLVITGESLDVEKKFDKCIVEGFDFLLPEISVNTIVVPLSDPTPTPSPENFLRQVIEDWEVDYRDDLENDLETAIETYPYYVTDGSDFIIFASSPYFGITTTSNDYYIPYYVCSRAYNTHSDWDQMFPVVVFFRETTWSHPAVYKSTITNMNNLIAADDLSTSWIGNFTHSETYYTSSYQSLNQITLGTRTWYGSDGTHFYRMSGNFQYTAGWSGYEYELEPIPAV